ncbi:MAG: DUF3857 domain-containing protein [Candidatus Poribacteria bacterium]|nr:DUF3857 domain-containing protein [Candidatus Poribacteria bacterium]MDE0504306.1 DUF3857 domain-containing protein [Candidatus Poribacteria bacterium]
MLIRWTYKTPIVVLLLLLNGCAILKSRQETEERVVDPLVERREGWKKQIDRGNWAFQNGDFETAITAYQAALALKPESAEVQRKIGEIYYQQKHYEKAAASFTSYLISEPRDTSVRNYLGYTYEKLNDYDAAAREYEATLKYAPEDLYALNHLGLAYKQTGHLDEAERTLRKVLELDPKCRRNESKNLHNYLGAIHMEREETGDAIAEFRESARLFPNDVWPRQQLAALYESHGRYYQAQLQYQEILSIDPDNLLAPTRLQALSQLNTVAAVSPQVDPVKIVEFDSETIIAEASQKHDFPDADVIILMNQFSHDISPNGQSRYTTHQIVKLVSQRGIEKYDDIAIPYQPNSQHLNVNIARTITPDGTIVEPPDEGYNEVTPPGLLSYNIYSDVVWKVISMPALSPGAIIEYQVTFQDIATESVGKQTWFWGGFNFQSTVPTLEARYALRLPGDLKFRWKTLNCDLQPQVLKSLETTTYLWSASDVPPIGEETGMPAVNDVAMRLSYSSLDSWDEVYTWYKDLAKDRYHPDHAIQSVVDQLTMEVPKTEDKIRAIYNFVASKIRYVGIELGQSAYQPSFATDVMNNLYGDCKDKTTLLITMLDLAGVKAFPLMLNPSPHERIDTDLPSLGQFSHMITAVPDSNGDHLWLDATSNTCSFGDLPDANQGRVGFLIGDETGVFVDIPIFPAEANQLILKTDMRLDEQGSVNGEISMGTTGQYNLDSRLRYQQLAQNDWKDTLAAELSIQFPGVHVEWVKSSNLENLDAPVEIRAGFRVDDYAQIIDSRILLPLPIDEFGDYAELFAATERKYPLDLGYPMHVKKVISIELPAGWTAILPADLSMESGFATVNRQFSRDENLVRYELDFTLHRSVIRPDEYAAAKRLFDTLAREDSRHLILVHLQGS